MNDHDVVLYGNDSAALTHCVVPFIASAVQDSGAAVVVASAEHERAFRSALAAVAVDAESTAMRERLVFLNAHDIVKGLLVGGQIDPMRFERLVGKVIRKLRKRYTIHAYGELVGILCSMGRRDAAARLEELWKELLNEEKFRLLCGYPIDVLGPEFHPAATDLVLTSHVSLVSTLPDFASALNAGIESTLGSERAAAIRGMIAAKPRPGWATLGELESTLLWLREHLPDDSAKIIEAAKARFNESVRK